MKVPCSKIFKISIIFIAVISTISCEKNSDLLVEYVLSDNLHEERLDEFVVDDFPKTIIDQREVLDALEDGTFTD